MPVDVDSGSSTRLSLITATVSTCAARGDVAIGLAVTLVILVGYVTAYPCWVHDDSTTLPVTSPCDTQ